MQLFKALFFHLSIFIVLLMGCGDPCDDVICANGDCIEGVCDCDPGFQGVNCDQRIPCFEVDCNNGTCLDDSCICDDGYEGEFCELEFRERFIGRWSGPNKCNIDIDQVPIPDSISITIFKSDADILSVELALDFDEFGQVPRQLAVLEGNGFFIEPDPVDVMGIMINYEITGILRNSGILEMETELNTEFNGFPISITCDASLEKN